MDLVWAERQNKCPDPRKFLLFISWLKDVALKSDNLMIYSDHVGLPKKWFYFLSIIVIADIHQLPLSLSVSSRDLLRFQLFTNNCSNFFCYFFRIRFLMARSNNNLKLLWTIKVTSHVRSLPVRRSLPEDVIIRISFKH